MIVNRLKLPTHPLVLPYSHRIGCFSQLEMVALQQKNQGLMEELNVFEKDNTLGMYSLVSVWQIQLIPHLILTKFPKKVSINFFV